MTISAQATPSQGPTVAILATPAKPEVIASMESLPPGAQGFMRRLQDGSNGGEKPYALFGRVRNHTFKSDFLETKSKHCEKLDTLLAGLWKNGNILLKKYWDPRAKDVRISIGRLSISHTDGAKKGQADFHAKIKEEILKAHPGASDLAINFGDMTVRFLEGGERQEIGKEQLPKEVVEILTFLNEWQEAHETAMLIMGIQNWHTRLDIDGNRPVHGDVPFIAENTHLNNFIPKTADQFREQGHLQSLIDKLPGDMREGAERRIQKAEDFIQQLGTNLDAKLEEKKTALAGVDENQKALMKKLQKEEAILKKIKEQLDAIHRYAVFWAVAFWGSSNPSDITPKRQSEKAQLLTNAMLEVFNKTRNISSEMVKTPIGWYRSKETDQDDLKSIAIQTGDLLFHSDLDYLARFDSSGARRMVRPAIEELVVHNMMHLDAPEYIDDLTSLGLQTVEPEMRAELRSLIKDARTVS